MMRLISVILLLVPSVVRAALCVGREDGAACYLSGNVPGYCKYEACQPSQAVMAAGEVITGTGTISSSGGTVTGSGTIFTTQVQVGDVLGASGQSVAVVVVTDDTHLITNPFLGPAIVAGTVYTLTKPTEVFVDATGTRTAIIDGRGFVSIGVPYASFPFRVQGPSETGAHVDGRQIYMQAGQGGPAASTVTGGIGGAIQLLAGEGGDSAVSGKAPGTGGGGFLSGGVGGATSIAGNPDGAGGLAWMTGGAGGYGGSGTGGAGGLALVTGGDGSPGGAAGPVSIRVGAGAGSAVTPIGLCDSGGGVVTVGSTVQTKIDCVSGDLTKIKNVSVAGTWNVIAYEQANLGGM